MGLSDFKTDRGLERTGIKMDYGDFRVLIARAGGANEEFKRTFTKLFEPHKRAAGMGRMPEDVAEDLLIKAFAKSVVLGWETRVDGEWVSGIDFEDGEGVQPYSEENVIRVFKEVPDIFRELREDADNIANFRREHLEESAKNS